MTTRAYPLAVEAQLDRPLSRWLWLVKWFLAIPHFVVLAFLWAAFAAVSVIAFFSILFSGRYPRALFDFNVGVLRWSWRVGYYAYSALGTDRYPPFTLEEVPAYPAHLRVEYPERLSRGLVLVKWWLLALPHYLVVGVLMGGAWIVWREEGWAGPGLIGLLALVAAVVLTFTGTYPRGLFDLLLGLNRWVLRVAAYAGLMTDEYPPFRLDTGGSEAAGTLDVSRPVAETSTPGAGTASGWTAGRVVAVALGSLLALTGLGVAAGGGVLLWADRVGRDDAGFISTPTEDLSTDAYAIVAEDVELRGLEGVDWTYASSLLGEARLRVTSDSRVFTGVAPAADVARYLGDVRRASLERFPDDPLVTHAGEAPATAPADETFWTASTQGAGTQDLRWEVEEGTWSLVVMNADASRGVYVTADVGAEVPALGAIAAGLLVGGLLLLMGGGLLIGVAVTRASRTTTQPAK